MGTSELTIKELLAEIANLEHLAGGAKMLEKFSGTQREREFQKALAGKLMAEVNVLRAIAERMKECE